MDIDIIKSEFDRICDEQEKIDSTGFGKVLQCLNEEVLQGIKHSVLFPFTDNVEAITKALEMTGHKKDEAFCARFMKSYRLFVEGKQIQAQGLDIIANAIPKCGKQSGGFYFVPISIYTPADNNELQQAISDILEQEAKEGKGLYANITQIPKEDEFLDSLLCVEAFNCKHSFTKWLDELKRYNVAGKQGAFLNEKLTRFLFELVNKCANVIKDNTDSPNKTKNSLNDIISSLDELSVWGLFFQILMLQGLFTMLESIDINEEQNGFDEAQSLYDWIAEILYKKIIRFSRGYYGDNDLATLQPFCEYLCTTAAGEAVQQRVKSEYYPELQKTASEQREALQTSTGKVKNRETQEEITKPLTDGGKPQFQIPPKELCTDKAVKIFEYAIKEGLMERNGNRYKWTKTNSLYGYFVDKVSDKLDLKSSANRIQWKLFERIVTNHKELLSTAKQAVNDYSNKNLPPPENDNIVNSILKHL